MILYMQRRQRRLKNEYMPVAMLPRKRTIHIALAYVDISNKEKQELKGLYITTR